MGPKEKRANSAKRMNFTALPSSSLSNCKGLPGMGRVGQMSWKEGKVFREKRLRDALQGRRDANLYNIFLFFYFSFHSNQKYNLQRL